MDHGSLLSSAHALLPEMQALRRKLHQHPEIGLELPASQALIVKALSDLDADLILGQTCSSVIAVLTGSRPGPTVVLRADMDALPIQEAPGSEPRSLTENAMHACGHDLHSATLVGAATLLSSRTKEMSGRVVLVWQPGEEGYDGMQVMLDEGLMEVIGAEAVATYGLHVLADTFPHRVFSGRAGVSHATSATFQIKVSGVGGHAAFPHAAVDPVPAAAEIALGLQIRLTRTVNIFDPAVITVGSIHGGNAPNVIPESVVLAGTVRAFSQASANQLPDLVRSLAAGIALAHGVRAEVDYREGYPVVDNDKAEVDLLRGVVQDLLGTERFQELAVPIPAGDDYSRLMQLIPGAFFLVGAGIPDGNGRLHPNHSAGANFDDGVMGDGAAVLAAAALRRLSDNYRPDPLPR